MKIVVPTTLAVLASSALAVAAIPGADGTVRGCYSTSILTPGALRVVDEGVGCRSSERLVTWNQKGEKGDPGATGAPGAPGSGGSGLVLGGEALAGGRADAFLKLDGVEGDVTVRGHEGEIALKSFSFGVSNSGTITTGPGGGSGRTSFAKVKVSKLVDRSTPTLIKSTASGRVIPRGTITFRSRGEQAADFLTIQLKTVLITDWAQGGREEPVLLENVAFEAGQISYAVRSQLPDGTWGGETLVEWDQVRQSEGF